MEFLRYLKSHVYGFAGSVVVLVYIALCSRALTYSGSVLRTLPIEIATTPEPQVLLSSDDMGIKVDTQSSLETQQQHQLQQQRDLKSFTCDDFKPTSYHSQRGKFWVLYNYFKAEANFRCDQSITYTTHADWTFLDNLVPLLERWQGPMSITLYAPGTDFGETLTRILYLRKCVSSSPLVKEMVSFHIMFDRAHVPKFRFADDHTKLAINCSAIGGGGGGGSLEFGEHLPTFKKLHKLLYPVNVARNVAKEMARTNFVLASDIELYPNPGLIPQFLEMIQTSKNYQVGGTPKVFVLPIFEVEADVPALPSSKSELIYMLRNGWAVPFHKYVCPHCHRIPKGEEWSNTAPLSPNALNVFHVAHRKGPYHHWEPIYIGTKSDPIYDERLSYEGRREKMTQGYILCLLDYEFHILDNAFLVHRPGIKRHKNGTERNPTVFKQKLLITNTILPELNNIYGTKPGCLIN